MTVSGLREDQLSLRRPASGWGSALPLRRHASFSRGRRKPVASGRLEAPSLACAEEVGAPRQETWPGMTDT